MLLSVGWISVSSTENLKGILEYLKDFCHLQQNNYYICACPKYLFVNLWKVALKLEFQFAPCTTRNFHSTSPVSLSPNCISISRFQCTVGTDVIQGHVHTGDRRARYTQVWTRGHINSYFNQKKHLKYIIDQHKSVSRVDRAQIRFPSHLPKRKNKKITHTQIEMLPIKVD